MKKFLDDGYFSIIELVDTTSNFDGINMNSKVKAIQKRLKITLEDEVSKQSAINIIKNLIPQGKKENYDEMQVFIKGLPGGTTSSPRFSLDQTDAADLLFSRLIILKDFKNDLDQCYKAIHSEIEDKLISELLKSSQW